MLDDLVCPLQHLAQVRVFGIGTVSFVHVSSHFTPLGGDPERVATNITSGWGVLGVAVSPRPSIARLKRESMLCRWPPGLRWRWHSRAWATTGCKIVALQRPSDARSSRSKRTPLSLLLGFGRRLGGASEETDGCWNQLMVRYHFGVHSDVSDEYVVLVTYKVGVQTSAVPGLRSLIRICAKLFPLVGARKTRVHDYEFHVPQRISADIDGYHFGCPCQSLPKSI